MKYFINSRNAPEIKHDGKTIFNYPEIKLSSREFLRVFCIYKDNFKNLIKKIKFKNNKELYLQLKRYYPKSIVIGKDNTFYLGKIQFVTMEGFPITLK